MRMQDVTAPLPSLGRSERGGRVGEGPKIQDFYSMVDCGQNDSCMKTTMKKKTTKKGWKREEKSYRFLSK